MESVHNTLWGKLGNRLSKRLGYRLWDRDRFWYRRWSMLGYRLERFIKGIK
jgi:hypothetical protein